MRRRGGERAPSSPDDDDDDRRRRSSSRASTRLTRRSSLANFAPLQVRLLLSCNQLSGHHLPVTHVYPALLESTPHV